MSLFSHEGLSGAHSSLRGTRTIEKGSFVPHARDKNNIIDEFLRDAPQGSILDLNRREPGPDLAPVNPIVTVDFIRDPSTRRTLDDFLTISTKQTREDRERRKRKSVLPRSGIVFSRKQASLSRT